MSDRERRNEKPRHLGRGLESLLGPITMAADEAGSGGRGPAVSVNFPPDAELRDSLREIDVISVSPNPHQARMAWDEAELVELADAFFGQFPSRQEIETELAPRGN